MLPSFQKNEPLLTLGARVNQHLWDETSQEELEQGRSELEGSPVVSVFHDFQAVAVEANITSKVLLMESLHWDLGGSLVLVLVLLLVEGQVVFDWLAWKFGLFILAWGISGYGPPEDNEQWEEEKKSEEDESLDTSAKLAGYPEWNNCEKESQGNVGKVLVGRTFSGERGIGDSWRLEFTENTAELAN